VVIHATEEGRCCVLTDVFDEVVTTPRVLVQEVGNIMDEPGDKDEWPLGSLLLD
jgi:hypothetical protein